jgi:hypothetical protein
MIPPFKLLLDKLKKYYLSNKLKAIAVASQTPPTTIVIRSKFFSTTEDPPYVEEIPPPKRSDKPEPLPLWSKTKIIISTLHKIKRIDRAKFIYSPSRSR